MNAVTKGIFSCSTLEQLRSKGRVRDSMILLVAPRNTWVCLKMSPLVHSCVEAKQVSYGNFCPCSLSASLPAPVDANTVTPGVGSVALMLSCFSSGLGFDPCTFWWMLVTLSITLSLPPSPGSCPHFVHKLSLHRPSYKACTLKLKVPQISFLVSLYKILLSQQSCLSGVFTSSTVFLWNSSLERHVSLS